MTTKTILFNEESRKAIKKGVDTVANFVKVTLGAKGKTVLIGRKWGSQITKDGITAAKSVMLLDEIESVGANVIKEVSQKTVNMAGDGTTTAMVLAQAIVDEGFKLVAAGYNGIELKHGIDKAVDKCCDVLKEISIPVDIESDMLQQVATISANGDEKIGETVADIIKKTGNDGIVNLEESQTGSTYTKVVEGLNFERGYLSPMFVNDFSNLTCQLVNPYILVAEGKISTLNDIKNIFEAVFKTNRHLLLIAEEFEGEALSVILHNRAKTQYNLCCVKAPSFGDNRKDVIKDIAVSVGATVANDESGIRLDTLKLEHLGSADKVIITKDETTIVGGKGQQHDITSQIEYIKKAIELCTVPFEKAQLENRLAKLSGGIGIIYVGAQTDAELKELYDRYDDAKRATQSALSEGVIVGGGISFIKCIEKLKFVNTESESEKEGVKLVQKILESPFRQMVKNSGRDISISDALIGKDNWGYNFKTNEWQDLVVAGVLDAKKVVRVSLQNAASVASTLLTTEAMIVNVEPDNFVNPLQQR